MLLEEHDDCLNLDLYLHMKYFVEHGKNLINGTEFIAFK